MSKTPLLSLFFLCVHYYTVLVNKKNISKRASNFTNKSIYEWQMLSWWYLTFKMFWIIQKKIFRAKRLTNHGKTTNYQILTFCEIWWTIWLFNLTFETFIDCWKHFWQNLSYLCWNFQKVEILQLLYFHKSNDRNKVIYWATG